MHKYYRIILTEKQGENNRLTIFKLHKGGFMPLLLPEDIYFHLTMIEINILIIQHFFPFVKYLRNNINNINIFLAGIG